MSRRPRAASAPQRAHAFPHFIFVLLPIRKTMSLSFSLLCSNRKGTRRVCPPRGDKTAACFVAARTALYGSGRARGEEGAVPLRVPGRPGTPRDP